MRDYELLMVISPDLDNESVPATVDRVQQFILERGGQITQVDNWGRRKLAYPIDRFQEGNYVVTQFRLDPARVRDLESTLQLAEDVIRHLVVKVGD
ncbi:MAG TPA: 30S ribosomal protein S6 [Dehalococcoidia bacterium]|nr:30S ribosomal protein S6 [Dehalococcoidia bacterium]